MVYDDHSDDNDGDNVEMVFWKLVINFFTLMLKSLCNPF